MSLDSDCKVILQQSITHFIIFLLNRLGNILTRTLQTGFNVSVDALSCLENKDTKNRLQKFRE
jgi:hypothetical protein